MRIMPVLAGLIFFCAMGIATAQQDSAELPFPPNSKTPVEEHKWLWENELRPRLEKMFLAEKSMDEMTATNWQEYDITFYRLDLTIDHAARILYGRVGVFGRVTVESLDSIKLNLLSNMTVDSVYAGTGKLSYMHISDYLTVSLDRLYAQGEDFSFTVAYHGRPVSSGSFQGFTFGSRSGSPLITTLSQPFGARSWWPCNDITADKADSADIIVTVDTSLDVSSNGIIVSDGNNGNGTHTVYWKERYPIVPYLISLGIHPYTVWGDWYHYNPDDSMPLQFFVYPDHEALSRQYFAVLDGMIGELAQIFGEYPYLEEKYGCTHFSWSGAMEHQTNTSTQASSWGYSEDIICHELAHQWWGDMVTCSDWHHIWINEGFATYAEALYQERMNGIGDYHNYMNQIAYMDVGSIYIYDTTQVWNIFGWIVYNKGAWVLHMLRHVIGDDALFASFTELRQAHQWSVASTEDYKDIVESLSGEELDYFFQEWIYGTKYPIYRISFFAEADGSGGWINYLHIRQTQTSLPQVFAMPVDIRLSTSGPDEILNGVWIDRRGQNLVVPTADQVTEVTLDPDGWILKQTFNESYSFHIIDTALAVADLYNTYADTVTAKGGSGSATFSLVSGDLPDSLLFDPSLGVISGRPMEAGSFPITIASTNNANVNLTDTAAFILTVAAPSADIPGDANVDRSVNIGDAVFLINYVFRSGQAPFISDWADVNADCDVNAGDAVYLVNHIFRGGDAPVLGCVNR